MERLDYNTVLNTAIDISKAGKKIMEIYNNVDIASHLRMIILLD